MRYSRITDEGDAAALADSNRRLGEVVFSHMDGIDATTRIIPAGTASGNKDCQACKCHFDLISIPFFQRQQSTPIQQQIIAHGKKHKLPGSGRNQLCGGLFHTF